MTNVNKPVPGADQYYPLNEPELGQLLPVDKYPHNAALPKLFEPLTVRGVTFRNRIFVSPMCQYSSDNGHATDWHFVHVGALATRGPGAITMEATSVTPEGRISPEDAGLWTDTQIPPLQRIVKFAHAHQAVIGVQLSHAGRKASTIAPWVHTDLAKTKNPKSWVAHEDEGGWPDNVLAPSAIAYVDYYPLPKAMTEENIRYVEDGFVKAIDRVKQVGYDFIELHAAHGYLFHNFLSPLSNKRTDQYGGSLENRMRWPLRVIKLMRDAWDGPFFVRISATDWADFPRKAKTVIGSNGVSSRARSSLGN
ncbi:hypothetical protein QCA50_002356 [Cerrena zonata]|uniref:NADH:flavin oxidoreductase/NADH oxidase N-terminal domain-containing protein n=1 Tax=Cerrena zonata TaxID=2478898 RepID=A0AAW0GNW4_9APHY